MRRQPGGGLSIRFFAGVSIGAVFGYIIFIITAMLFRASFQGGDLSLRELKREAAQGIKIPASRAKAFFKGESAAAAAPVALVQPPSVVEAPPPANLSPPSAPSTSTSGEDADIHIVFTSGCDAYQHYQAELIFDSHMRVGQPGPITRIVSGCGPGDSVQGGKKFRSHHGGLTDAKTEKDDLFKWVNPNARVHLTPDFEGGEAFPWMNKPLGIEHWIQNANPPIKESTIVIIDSDMVFTEKLVLGKKYIDHENGNATPKGGLLCKVGCPGGKFKGGDAQGLTDKVLEGQPIGQHYGIGAQWIQTFNLEDICGEGTPAKKVTQAEGHQYYTVGPPLMMHRNDLAKLAPLWAKYMLKVVDKNKYDILADMYAYSIAAAHLELPHLVLDNYMYSNGKYPDGEGWDLEKTWDMSFRDSATCSNPWPSSADGKSHLPNFAHLCQTYEADGWSYHKGRVPPNLLGCDLPLLKMPPEDLISKQPRGGRSERMARMVCTASKAVNDAMLNYRKKYCPPQPWNEDQTIRISSAMQKCEGKTPQGEDYVLGKNCWSMAKVEA